MTRCLFPNAVQLPKSGVCGATRFSQSTTSASLDMRPSHASRRAAEGTAPSLVSSDGTVQIAQKPRHGTAAERVSRSGTSLVWTSAPATCCSTAARLSVVALLPPCAGWCHAARVRHIYIALPTRRLPSVRLGIAAPCGHSVARPLPRCSDPPAGLSGALD